MRAWFARGRIATFAVLFLLGSMLVATPHASAGGASYLINGVIITKNDLNQRVWVTIYDLGKTRHMEYGWVDPHTFRTWDNCCFAAGSYYHVRGEVAQEGDRREHPHVVFDTTIQVVPKLCQVNVPKSNGESTPHTFGYGRVIIRKGTGNYYWVRDDRGNCHFN